MDEAGQPPARNRRGLTEAEAQRLLAAAGEREALPSSRTTASIVRANTFTVFNLILLVFFVVVVAAGRPADGLFLGVLIANTGLGITQELRAKRALDRAALLVAPHARVVREGREREVPVAELVDGDLVMLAPGDQVLADGRVAESVGLMLDESQLTGESVPVARQEDDEILSGAFCVEGRGAYVAERTGSNSYAARLLNEAREQTQQRSPLEVQINRLLKVLVGVMVPLGAAFVAVLIAGDVPFREAAAVSTAGIVSLVPEGLVLLTSLTFAAAAAALTRKGMLVQYLNAVESLANVDTVCVDKTGTLTDGNLALHEVLPLDGDLERSRGRLASFAAASGSRNETLQAIHSALPTAAAEAEAEVPFSSRWKWSAVRLVGEADWLVLGAPDVLLDGTAPEVVAEQQRLGRRVLVLGSSPAVEEPSADGTHVAAPEVRPLAVVVLQERLRPDAADTVSYLRRQGVRIRVMSGDSAVTVAAIADQVGIEALGEPVEGPDLPEDDAKLVELARTRAIFARLSPRDKQRLIDALAADGAYTAMMGDGVNDVPAMKRARLAVALGSGSQLAKSVADAVLIDGRFGAIPDAIAEGRRIIANVQRVAKLFVTKSVFAAVVIATFGLLTSDFPLLPRHLSLAAVFTVGIPGFLLALAPAGGGPVATRGFLRDIARFALPAGTVMAASVIFAYLAVANVKDHTEADGRTAATTVFVAFGVYLLLVLDADRMQASRRHAVVVVAMAAALLAGYLWVLGSETGREFFALTRPGWWELIVVTGSAILAIKALAWLGLSPYRHLDGAGGVPGPPALSPSAGRREPGG